MRYFIILLSLFFSFSFASDDLLDIDYNFVNHAFDNIKPVSDKQFSETIDKLKPAPVPETFGGKVKSFLFGRKSVADVKKEEPKILQTQSDSEAIKEITRGVFYITLSISIVGEDNKIIPLGNYKIKQEDNKLAFYQGYEKYGTLKLEKFEDNNKGKFDIAYSRVDVVSDEIVRIVYSTIDDTQCAIARIVKEN